MEEMKNCPVCNTKTHSYSNYDRFSIFYSCPVCGRFELEVSDKFDFNQLAPYLVHNRFMPNASDYRYYTTLDKETCDKYRTAFDNGDRTNGRPVHFDAEIIRNWYPKTFSERVDYILLYINKKIKHIGQQVSFSYNELLSVMFIDRKDYLVFSPNVCSTHKSREDDDCEHELRYMIEYLVKCSYIEFAEGPSLEDWCSILLTPEGYSRVEVLQKNTSQGKKVLVAMKFGDETKSLREAIRKGITDAEYEAVFIDEVQHNDFITPELLKHIRDSKFVVVDLTHQNNGAYFEEGYAMGLGKSVIQLCQKGIKLHFDIAQKNTIIWETEDDIPERLTNRIKATID